MKNFSGKGYGFYAGRVLNANTIYDLPKIAAGNHLSGIYGYPHSIINEGIAGETTQEGLARLPSVLTKYTEASTFLVLYGTNDTNIWSDLESGL